MRYETMIGRAERALVVALWCAVPPAFAAATMSGASAVRFDALTAGLCLAGWFLSWASEWGTEYMQRQRCLTRYMVEHLPRLLIGLVSAGVCYVMLPDLTGVLGVSGKVGAFLCGIASDFVVQRIKGLIPQRDRPPPPEAGGP